jgi:hypothetical protein
MAMAIKRYTINDFDNIKNDGFDYKLSESILSCISELSLEVGSPSYVKTPIFKKKDNLSFKKKKKNPEVLTDDDWESLRTFQTTTITEKEGLDKQFDLIRSHLNKLSDKNYNIILQEIVDILNKNMDELSNEDREKISLMIYDLVSSNRFYSKLYASIYTELINLHSWMMYTFIMKKKEYLSQFDNMVFVDASEDYTNFCNCNNQNEKRKASSSFLINLMDLHIVDIDFIRRNLLELISSLKKHIEMDNKKSHVDELMENISILLVKDKFNHDETEIYQIIELISQSKSKDYPSLTNKTIFKCMDLLEK